MTANASRYIVGIDLGTTNCALAYVDTEDAARTIRLLATPQLVAPGQVEALDTLPSFLYLPAAGEFPPESLALPWDSDEPGFVGQFARDQGTLSPGRLVASAKSWLCHNGMDRTADILPWQGGEDVPRVSPVTSSGRYLLHYRRAWDRRFPDHPLAGQEIVLTLPASFDEVARELTVKAAAQAGLPRVTLLEEPQAAFYAWIAKHADDWDALVTPGQTILVVDIGGGTTDFTLIRVKRSADGLVEFHRVAVGQHLILGGDNLDLALARHLEQKLRPGGQLEPRQWSTLVRVCRGVKETLLGDRPPEKTTIHLPGSGSRLLGGGLQTDVTRDEATAVLADGFFPPVPLDSQPVQQRSGFQEFGLPYAPDPAMTRYLAAFLTAHRTAGLDMGTAVSDRESLGSDSGRDPGAPDIVLFNGGVMSSPVLRDRVRDALVAWFRPGDAAYEPRVLDHERLDLAVAKGAAYYGRVRRGEGVRIKAGLARSYYVGLESHPPVAICLLPAGIEPGDAIDLSQRAFRLRVSEPVEFPIYTSSLRLTDPAGAIVPFDRDQLTPLPPIRTVLRTSKKGDAGLVTVHLQARLTEIGTLDLSCREADGPRQWKLAFDVRSATQTDRTRHEGLAERQGFFDESLLEPARQLIRDTFAKGSNRNTAQLMKDLGSALALPRDDWPPSLLRELWQTLMEVEAGRRNSQHHESRWLNLLGFSLRPGYGLAVDDWRVAETWKLLNGRLVHPGPMVRVEYLILWRRIAGGLTAGQQQSFAAPLVAALRQQQRGRSPATSAHEQAETWRMLGSFELLPTALRVELGDLALDFLERGKLDAIRGPLLWTLGRLGSRQPVYGPLSQVLPVEVAARWLDALLHLRSGDPMEELAIVQLARRTHDRYRDLPDSLRTRVLSHLAAHYESESHRHLVTEGGPLESTDQTAIFGDTLPRGLQIL